MDGESDDGTLRILERLRSKIDVLIVEKDSGQSQALNRGFRHATGDWLAWLCADDELMPQALRDLARITRKRADADIVVGACERCIHDGNSFVVAPPDKLVELLPFKNPIDQPSTFWKRKFHDKAGSIDENLHYAMDWDWWCRLKNAGATFEITSKVISRYHFTGNNKTSRNPEGNLTETLEIVRRYAGCGGAIADVYRHIFEVYDKYGCLDNPPIAENVLQANWQHARKALSAVFGAEVVENYNLNWISKQMRGLSIH